MSRSALNAVVFTALILLAGCNFLGSDPSMKTPRVTPADVPTDSTVTPREQIAPGLTKYGLTNASALIEAHTDFLTNTSFTVREVWILESPNGTVAARRVITTRVEDDRIYSKYNSTGLRGPVYQELWSGRNRCLKRIVYNDSSTYHRISCSESSHVEEIPEPSVEFYRSFESWNDPRIERVSVNGTLLYRLETTYQNRPSNITITALVDSRGVIHSFTIREPITYPPVPDATRSIRSIQITDIGTTTVERPAWYAEAINKTTPANRTNATVMVTG